MKKLVISALLLATLGAANASGLGDAVKGPLSRAAGSSGRGRAAVGAVGFEPVLGGDGGAADALEVDEVAPAGFQEGGAHGAVVPAVDDDGG